MFTIDRAAAPATALASVPAVLATLAKRPKTALLASALPVAVALFFRDPERTPDRGPIADDLVLSPADGKVMYAGPAQPDVAPPGEWNQISIFLSGFDVHINRAPYGGTITDVTYRKGKWLAAYKHESAYLNERSDITVESEVNGEHRIVIYRQIVGLMARRVVTRVKPGDVTTTGQRIGLMKFGSRMDIFVPPHLKLEVAPGERTVAGETVLSRWPAAGVTAEAHA